MLTYDNYENNTDNTETVAESLDQAQVFQIIQAFAENITLFYILIF